MKLIGRLLILAALLRGAATVEAGNFFFNYQNSVTQPQGNGTLYLYSVNILANGQIGINTAARYAAQMPTNGVAVSNVVGGVYMGLFVQAKVAGPIEQSGITTNWFNLPQTNNALDYATNFFLNPLLYAGAPVYNTGQSDLRYWQTGVLGPGTNVTFYTNSQTGQVLIGAAVPGGLTNFNSGAVNLTNALNILIGSFAGNASLLTNLPPGGIASLALQMLSTNNGSWLTNLPASAIANAVLQALSTNNGSSLTNLGATSIASAALQSLATNNASTLTNLAPLGIASAVLQSLSTNNAATLTNLPASSLASAALQALATNNGAALTNVPGTWLTNGDTRSVNLVVVSNNFVGALSAVWLGVQNTNQLVIASTNVSGLPGVSGLAGTWTWLGPTYTNGAGGAIFFSGSCSLWICTNASFNPGTPCSGGALAYSKSAGVWPFSSNVWFADQNLNTPANVGTWSTNVLGPGLLSGLSGPAIGALVTNNAAALTNLAALGIASSVLQSLATNNASTLTNLTATANLNAVLQSVSTNNANTLTNVLATALASGVLQSLATNNASSLTNLSGIPSLGAVLQSLATNNAPTLTNLPAGALANGPLQSLGTNNASSLTNISSGALTSAPLQSLATNNASTLTNLPATAVASAVLQSLATNNASSLTNLANLPATAIASAALQALATNNGATVTNVLWARGLASGGVGTNVTFYGDGNATNGLNVTPGAVTLSNANTYLAVNGSGTVSIKGLNIFNSDGSFSLASGNATADQGGHMTVNSLLSVGSVVAAGFDAGNTIVANDIAAGGRFIGNGSGITNLPLTAITNAPLQSLGTNNASSLTNLAATAIASSVLQSLATNNAATLTNHPVTGIASAVIQSLGTNNASTLTNLPATAVTSSTLQSLATNNAATLSNAPAVLLSGVVSVTNVVPTTTVFASPSTNAGIASYLSTNVVFERGTNEWVNQRFWRSLEYQLRPYADFLLATNSRTVGYGPMEGMDYICAGPSGAYKNFYLGDTPGSEIGCLKHYPATNLLALAQIVYAATTNGSGSKVLGDFFSKTGLGDVGFGPITNAAYADIEHELQPAWNLFRKTRSPLVWQIFNAPISNLVACARVYLTSKHLMIARGTLGIEGGNAFDGDVSSYLTMGWYQSCQKIYEMAATAGDTNAMAWVTNEIFQTGTNIQFVLMDTTAGLLKSGTNHANHDLLASAMAVRSGALFPSNAIAISSNLARQYGTGLYYSKQAQYQFPANEVSPSTLTNGSGFGFYWSTRAEDFGAAIELTHPETARLFWQDKANSDSIFGSFDNASLIAGFGANYSWTFFKYYAYILERAGDFPPPEPFPIAANPLSGVSPTFSATVYNSSNLFLTGFGTVHASDGSSVNLTTLNGIWYTNAARGSYTNPVNNTYGIYYEPDLAGGIAQIFTPSLASCPCWVMTNAVLNDPEGSQNWVINNGSAPVNPGDSYGPISYVANLPPNDANGNRWFDGDANPLGYSFFGTNTASQFTGLLVQGAVTASGLVTATNGFASYRSNSLAWTPITLGASPSLWTNTNSCNITALIGYANKGTVTSIGVNGQQVSTNAPITLPMQPGEWVGVTNSAVPDMKVHPF